MSVQIIGVGAAVVGDMSSRPYWGLYELDFVFSTLVVRLPLLPSLQRHTTAVTMVVLYGVLLLHALSLPDNRGVTSNVGAVCVVCSCVLAMNTNVLNQHDFYVTAKRNFRALLYCSRHIRGCLFLWCTTFPNMQLLLLRRWAAS